MPRFVEQGDDIVVRKQGRVRSAGPGKIACQVGDRGAYAVVCFTAAAFAVDPGAALLALAGVQVHEYMPEDPARALGSYLQRLDVGMPGADFTRAYDYEIGRVSCRGRGGKY